jgi:hypothetical protein
VCCAVADTSYYIDIEKAITSNLRSKLRKLLYIAALLFSATIVLARSSWCGSPTFEDPWLSGNQFSGTRTTASHSIRPAAKMEYEKCAATIASRTWQFGYNLTSEDATQKEWRFIHHTSPEIRSRFRGEITVDRGDIIEDSDIEVRIVSKVSNHTNLEHMVY